MPSPTETLLRVQDSPVLTIPMSVPYFAIPVGLGLMALFAVSDTVRIIRGSPLRGRPGADDEGEEPPHTPAHPEGKVDNMVAAINHTLKDEMSRNPSIDISRIDGQVRDSSIKKVGEVVSAHPEEALAIIRTWLHEPA